MSDPIKIFIGSGEQSLLERKVLIYSIKKHTQRPLDLYVFNGTHNSIEKEGQPPQPIPLSLQLKYKNKTEFSLYRYLVPELCSFQGKAIYVDSDMICLRDIGELYDTPLEGYDFLAKPQVYDGNSEPLWATSVLLMDCERLRFDLEKIFEEIDQRLYTYYDFSRFAKEFLFYHPYRIGPLDPAWNSFDRMDSHTKLIHYTDLFTQPWKYSAHPYGRIWFSYFYEARSNRWITNKDIDLTIQRGYVRKNLTMGNSPLLWDKIKYIFRRCQVEWLAQ